MVLILVNSHFWCMTQQIEHTRVNPCRLERGQVFWIQPIATGLNTNLFSIHHWIPSLSLLIFQNRWQLDMIFYSIEEQMCLLQIYWWTVTYHVNSSRNLLWRGDLAFLFQICVCLSPNILQNLWELGKKSPLLKTLCSLAQDMEN